MEFVCNIICSQFFQLECLIVSVWFFRSANITEQPSIMGCAAVEDSGRVAKCDELLRHTRRILRQGLHCQQISFVEAFEINFHLWLISCHTCPYVKFAEKFYLALT